MYNWNDNEQQLYSLSRMKTTRRQLTALDVEHNIKNKTQTTWYVFAPDSMNIEQDKM